MRKVLSLAWLVRAAAAVMVSMVVLHPGVAQAKWLRAESAKFIIYSDGDEKGLREYVAKLEEFDTILRAFNGVDPKGLPPRKFEMYLVKQDKDFQRVFPGADEQIRGIYSTSTGDIFATAILTPLGGGSTGSRLKSRTDVDSDNTVLHEYTHHFMFQYAPYAYPTWLVEGYAEYYATTIITGDYFEVGYFDKGRGQDLLFNKWIPMEDLLGKPLADIDPEKRTRLYAEGWLLTHYLLSTPEHRAQLAKYMKLVGQGASPVGAMQEATGLTPAALFTTLVAYSKGNIASLRTPFKRPQYAMTVTEMPPSADDLLLENQRLRRGEVDKAAKPALLARIRQAAAKYPNDRLAQLTLARAETEFGDRTTGEVILGRLLTADPKDSEALLLLANSRMDMGDTDDDKRDALYREAGKLLGRAYQADPDRYQVLYGYIRSRLIEPSFPTDNDMQVMLTAHDLAPQVEEITLIAARALMRRKRFEEAKGLLGPVANSPHGGEAAEAAKSLLKQIASVSG
ncbi:hypothetical protein QO010_001268 [Caulobacter ginsengisoli]|uniref:DUF1570 domain-containing protein n=1 Tax=Caulobacter ginsengisoli TaxID=400775 RepID=A0ABU0INA9_9CAUL|nr:hypothetical protein [Caulobacter ginsengisoli]MDQ0463497.1 hypothetical protein [Caulobacter ginsengisoli]